MSARGPHLLGGASGEPSVDLTPPRRAAAFCAHPDDSEFFVAGTFAKWAAAGTECTYVVLTDGSKGSWRPGDGASLVEVRQREQRAAAAAAGVDEVVFCGFEDGFLTADLATRRAVAEVIRRVRPDVLVTHDPWKRYRLHPDHEAAGRLCVDGIVAARDPGFHPDLLRQGLAPHRPTALLLFEADVANHAETVEEADHEVRLLALQAFTSQIATTHLYRLDGVDTDPMLQWRDRERQRLEVAGAWAGTTLAEPFRLIVDQI